MIRLLKSSYFEGYCDNSETSYKQLKESYEGSATNQLISFLEKMANDDFVVESLDREQREFLYALLEDTTAMKLEEVVSSNKA